MADHTEDTSWKNARRSPTYSVGDGEEPAVTTAYSDYIAALEMLADAARSHNYNLLTLAVDNLDPWRGKSQGPARGHWVWK